MVRLTTCPGRAKLVPALALLAAALCLGPVQAQRPGMPGIPPRPPLFGPRPGGAGPNMPGAGGPLFERVWTCSHCGREIGRGNAPPAKCPYCGVKLINGIGPADPKYNGGNDNPPPANHPGMTPPVQPNQPAAPPPNPQSGAPPQAAAAPPNGAGGQPRGGVINDPPIADEGEEPAAGPAAKAAPAGTATTEPVPQWVSFRRAVLGIAAMLAALVLLAVAVIVAYNVIVNQQRPAPSRGRRRRPFAEVD
jgi:DNA-directed RNA polymerase subunit RPC12/RpoP